MRTNGQTDATKLTVAFRNFGNASKKGFHKEIFLRHKNENSITIIIVIITSFKITIIFSCQRFILSYSSELLQYKNT
jgi:hypothetical protein